MNNIGKLKKQIVDFVLRIRFLDEIRIFFAEMKMFFAEAKSKFQTEKPRNGSYKDYKKAFWKHRVTYKEYMYSYEFWKLTEAERDKFISTSEVQCIYRKLGNKDVRYVFSNKPIFLCEFSSFVHRRWIDTENCSFDDFRDLVSSVDCIAKPKSGTRGKGIFKIQHNDIQDFEYLFKKLKDNDYIVEECITDCKEIRDFHPSSLNTIRVVTISNNGRCEIFAAIFRMGVNGNVIDNTHSGGIFAPINVETGKIEFPAIDNFNNHFEYHPNSNKKITGFHIPHWDKVVETCKNAASNIQNIRFAGWDIAIVEGGVVEIIEGNHAPDFDGGMQAPTKQGVKEKFQKLVLEVMNIDPIPYISVFKNK